MKLYILTHKREDRQLTYTNLPKSLQEKVVFVIQKEREEVFKQLNPNTNYLVLPDEIDEILPTRRYIYSLNKGIKHVTMDDDICFHCIKDGKRGVCQPVDVEWLFALMERYLDQYPIMGVRDASSFFGVANHTNTDDICYATRIMRICGYNTDLDFEWDDTIPYAEDLNLQLELVTKHKKLYGILQNFLVCSVSINNRSKQAGGITKRTEANHNASQERLVAKYGSKYVSVKYVKNNVCDHWAKVKIQWVKLIRDNLNMDIRK
jgi:hypothetical protein